MILKIFVTKALQNASNYHNINNKTLQLALFLISAFAAKFVIKNTIMNRERKLQANIVFMIKCIN